MISAGSKSGVNWMRLNFELIAFEIKNLLDLNRMAVFNLIGDGSKNGQIDKIGFDTNNDFDVDRGLLELEELQLSYKKMFIPCAKIQKSIIVDKCKL